MKGSSCDLFKILSLILPGVIKENHEKSNLEYLVCGQDLKLEPSKYEVGVITT
jgi:hypothetical protein